MLVCFEVSGDFIRSQTVWDKEFLVEMQLRNLGPEETKKKIIDTVGKEWTDCL